MVATTDGGVLDTAGAVPQSAGGDPRPLPSVTAVNGSPARPSRLARALADLAVCMERLGCHVETLDLKDIPPMDLLGPPPRRPQRPAWGRAGTADLLILGSPIYKSAYSGLLKCWLDHLPRDGFRAKLVLPIATCHDDGDAVAFTESIRHVCTSMGVARLLPTVVLPASVYDPRGSPSVHGRARLEEAVRGALRALVEHDRSSRGGGR